MPPHGEVSWSVNGNPVPMPELHPEQQGNINRYHTYLIEMGIPTGGSILDERLQAHQLHFSVDDCGRQNNGGTSPEKRKSVSNSVKCSEMRDCQKSKVKVFNLQFYGKQKTIPTEFVNIVFFY